MDPMLLVSRVLENDARITSCIKSDAPPPHQNTPPRITHSESDSLSKTDDLLTYGQLLCDLSRGAEEHLGLKVDRRLEKKFIQSYHSGQPTTLLHAWMRMMGELWRRGTEKGRRA